MDRRIVLDKLESLRRCVARVEAKRPDTLDGLLDNLDLQDILALNLTRAVQVSVDIAAHLISGLDVPAPDTLAGAFEARGHADVLSPARVERMRAAVSVRDVAVHAYQTVNRAVVFAIGHEHLAGFRAYARAVAEPLDATP